MASCEYECICGRWGIDLAPCPGCSPLCVCGHTEGWHGDYGFGSCEHDGSCDCQKFEEKGKK